jgi:pimeloyl-ACP methyl ester carboxylesterase
MPRATVNGIGLFYQDLGAPGGEPVVLIMGWGGDHTAWAFQLQALAESYRVIAPDNRGAGQSDQPDAPYSIAGMADDVATLLAQLGVERAHVCGASMGGMIAQELALAHPERVASLVLVGTYGRADAKRRLVLDLWKSMVELHVPAELRIKKRLIWTLGDATMEQEDLIEAMWRFYLRDDAPMDDKVFVRQAEACMAHDALERLGEIAVPTLVVCGEGDILTPPHMARQLADRIKGARLVLLPNAGHLVAAELAPRFNRLVSRFLAEQERSGAQAVRATHR